MTEAQVKKMEAISTHLLSLLHIFSKCGWVPVEIAAEIEAVAAGLHEALEIAEQVVSDTDKEVKE